MTTNLDIFRGRRATATAHRLEGGSSVLKLDIEDQDGQRTTITVYLQNAAIPSPSAILLDLALDLLRASLALDAEETAAEEAHAASIPPAIELRPEPVGVRAAVVVTPDPEHGVTGFGPWTDEPSSVLPWSHTHPDGEVVGHETRYCPDLAVVLQEVPF